MQIPTIILNDREAREAKSAVAEFEKALASETMLSPQTLRLPAQVVDGYRKAVKAQKDEIVQLVAAYEAAKSGDHSALSRRSEKDPGIALVVARIARELTQKELARKLGLKEQQVQRYEADRYRSISIANFQRVASVLGVRWDMKFSDWMGSGWNIAGDVSATDIKKIVKHGRSNGWFEEEEQLKSEDSFEYLQRYVSDHIIKYGAPSLLRTGLSVEPHSNDLFLVAWKARVTRRAEAIIEKSHIEYRSLDIGWLADLTKLSEYDDGPKRAREFLLLQGIVMIAESQIPGMKVDGAAFLVNGVPVIGLTLRRDSIDSFWFTLFHEVAHVLLHFRTGLATGFFDDMDFGDLDEIEKEANEFASNILIPEEKWKRSPARIANSITVVEKFAKDLEIHSAIVFGRIQKERSNYATFSDKIGRGLVRKILLNSTQEVNTHE
jgi:HTH-type transcriptional regulator / antitoxin HigA